MESIQQLGRQRGLYVGRARSRASPSGVSLLCNKKIVRMLLVFSLPFMASVAVCSVHC